MDATLDRAVGAFVGLAVGDALGTTLEFTRRDSLQFHTEIIGGGPFRVPAGAWTDDTSMALALATSLAERGRLDPADVAARFIAWWRSGDYSWADGCFDIGIATREALARVERTGDPFGGSTDPLSAGNGSLMRLAPVVLPHLGDAEAAARDAAVQSRITHGAPEAVDACALFARLLVHAVATGEALADWPAGLEAAVAGAATAPSRPREAIASSGYVVHTLEAALWAVGTTESFADAVIAAVNLADDADTVGAVTGQLAGALYGASAIPERWREQLVWGEHIEALARRLATPSGT